MTARWDIRAEPYEGMSFDQKAGKMAPATGTKIRYRKKGSRGRFKSFVVVGELTGTLPEIVDKYEEQFA